MKKKFLFPILNLINCICMVLLCTTLTGCSEELSEFDSQLFQITCKALKEKAGVDNTTDTIKYAGMVCEYDEEKYETKVLATEIRSNGYNTPYSDGNLLSYTVTFKTPLSETSLDDKVTVSAVMTFNLSSATATQKIANYIFCTVDSQSRSDKYKTFCNNDGYQYSKRAINAEELVTLVRTGELNGHSIKLSASEKNASFQIYESTTSANYKNNGLKDLNVLSAVYDGSFHQAATTISSKQLEICQVALGLLINKTEGVNAAGDVVMGYRANAVNYILSKMNGAYIEAGSNPALSGSLVSSYFNENTDYSFDENTSTTTAGCQASINLTKNNTYQYNATYTFRASKSIEGTEEIWTIIDSETSTSFVVDDVLYEIPVA